jgi:hypothetical protein
MLLAVLLSSASLQAGATQPDPLPPLPKPIIEPPRPMPPKLLPPTLDELVRHQPLVPQPAKPADPPVLETRANIAAGQHADADADQLRGDLPVAPAVSQ